MAKKKKESPAARALYRAKSWRARRGAVRRLLGRRVWPDELFAQLDGQEAKALLCLIPNGGPLAEIAERAPDASVRIEALRRAAASGCIPPHRWDSPEKEEVERALDILAALRPEMGQDAYEDALLTIRAKARHPRIVAALLEKPGADGVFSLEEEAMRGDVPVWRAAIARIESQEALGRLAASHPDERAALMAARRLHEEGTILRALAKSRRGAVGEALAGAITDPGRLASLAMDPANAEIAGALLSRLWDEGLLVEAALRAEHPAARAAALHNLRGERSRMEVALRGVHEDVLCAVMETLPSERALLEVATGARDERARELAGARLTSQVYLNRAMQANAGSSIVLCALVGRISSAEVLEEIACTGTDTMVRCAAIERLESVEALRRIARDDKSAAVRAVAALRLGVVEG